MTVSAEIITTVASLATMLIALAGGFGWMISRTDAKFEAVEAKFDRLGDRISAVEREITEVKVAVARLEGPPPHLLRAR